jgi:hypothetical protein
MFQVVDGKSVYVVDFDELPKRPIHEGDIPELRPYAKALDDALKTGIITEPGKYGIWINTAETRYEIFKIIE